MLLMCLVCENNDHFPVASAEDAVAIDPRPRCGTCEGRHYVCYGCLGRLGFRDVPKHQLPCFEADEARVAIELVRGG